jgi:hypothetical protein
MQYVRRNAGIKKVKRDSRGRPRRTRGLRTLEYRFQAGRICVGQRGLQML